MGAPDDYAGKWGYCPKCKQAITIPDILDENITIKPAQVDIIKFRCPSCNQKVGGLL